VVEAVLISSTVAISVLAVVGGGGCGPLAAVGELRFPLYTCLRRGASQDTSTAHIGKLAEVLSPGCWDWEACLLPPASLAIVNMYCMELKTRGEVAAAARCPCLSFVITGYSQHSPTRIQLSKRFGGTTCGVSTAIPISINLLLQVDPITSVRNTTRHKTLTIRPGPRQDEVAEVLDAFGAESVRLGVGGDVLLEDEVLRGVEGVDGPVLGFDCEGEGLN
jgi:hypothetical protein